MLVTASLTGAPSATPTSAAPQSDEDACRPDVFRLCASAIPDTDAIVACLNASIPNLSPACRDVMSRDDPAGSVAPHRTGRSRSR